MTQRDPRMLPGMTASGAGRLFAWVTLALGAVGLATFIFVALAHPFDDLLVDIVAGIGPLVVWFGLTAIAAALAASRQRAELAAGYTTIDAVTSVDRLDPKTGAVVRPRAAVGAAPRSGSIANGVGLEPIAVPHGAVSIALRSPVAVGLVLAGAALVVYSIWSLAPVIDHDDAPLLAFGLLATFGGLVVLLVPVFALTILPMRRYLATITRAFPSCSVFVTYAGSTLRASAAELVTESDEPHHAHARLTSYVVVEPERLSFWSRRGRELRPFLVVSRTRITAAEIGTATDLNNNVVPAAILTIASDAGVAVRFELPLGPNRALNRWSASAEMSANAERLVRWQSTGAIG